MGLRLCENLLLCSGIIVSFRNLKILDSASYKEEKKFASISSVAQPHNVKQNRLHSIKQKIA